MNDSILESIKDVTGYSVDDSFDEDFITHINTVFDTLNDLGIGPPEGFSIEDDKATWTEFYGPLDRQFKRVQTYVYLRVRLYFDPPGTPHHLTALNDQIKELEYRLHTRREARRWLAAPSS